ncbi:MAG: hypothetical protein EP336_11095 [Rhodobacteraceae bacterium]|nr:MAG: hypothetical protein EP336_11095 [Paracoccaceae bacterium]
MSGQRLTVPEPEIKLYEQGFEAASDLGREPDGKKLSDLVERIEEPMVIAVDAPWGAGKSVFLKCWVGAHVKDNEGAATTVYFDAFKNDFMGDPLVSIFKEVSDRIESLKPKTADEAEQQRIAKLKALSGKAKKYAPILGRAALRLALGTAATEAIMDIENPDESSLDEMLANASSEAAKAIGSFWQAEETRTQAMDGFRTYLTELAAEQKLVIVVDELDRCRPDYALNLLEVIKHFFNVPNVHFVLGVNLTELENSVRARYGTEVNAGLYLQKFVTVTMPLPVRNRDLRWDANAKHFQNISASMGLLIANSRPDALWQAMEATIKDIAPNDLTLRSVEKMSTLLACRSHVSSYDWDAMGHDTLRACLILLKVCFPKIYRRILLREASFEEIITTLGMSDPRNIATTGQHYAFLAFGHIFQELDESAAERGEKLFIGHWGTDETFKKMPAPQILQKLAMEELEVFQLPS